MDGPRLASCRSPVLSNSPPQFPPLSPFPSLPPPPSPSTRVEAELGRPRCTSMGRPTASSHRHRCPRRAEPTFSSPTRVHRARTCIWSTRCHHADAVRPCDTPSSVTSRPRRILLPPSSYLIPSSSGSPSRPPCPVLLILSSLSRPPCPVLLVPSSLSRPPCPVLLVPSSLYLLVPSSSGHETVPRPTSPSNGARVSPHHLNNSEFEHLSGGRDGPSWRIPPGCTPGWHRRQFS
jgi:hypothetical protein